MVLKQFQKNLFHMLRSLARISWDTGVPLGGKGCFFPFITNFLSEVANQAKHWFVGMVFITSNRKLHLFDIFWTFKTQNTECNYMYVENCIFKKLKEALEIYKNQTKNHGVLAKIYKVYIICTPTCDAFGKFLSFY